MKRAMIISILFMFLTVGFSIAEQEEIQTVPTVDIPEAEDVPEVYIVKKGDTLWDIAERFFGDPFTWPDIWKKNLFIVDPHWIYPGQEITLQLLLEKIEEPVAEPFTAPVAEPEKVVKPLRQPEPLFIETAPRTVVSETLAEEEPLVTVKDPNVISVLSESQPAYREESYMRTGFIAKRSEIPREKVIKIEEETLRATKYDVVVINVGKKQSAKEGDLLAVLTVGDRVKHPDTDEDLGYVVRIKGILEILQTGDDQSRCMIKENFDPIAENDLIMSIRLTDAPKYDAWIRPEEIISGTLLAINEPLISIHINDILYIDRGSNHGVRPGDRFTIFSRADDKKDTGHREPLGEVQAVNVMASETAVIVVSLKGEKIGIGDRVELTARCRLIH